ncbi:small integral membrane protein 26 [Excalfactoria chinensis]|uniref:small integral membrane protein 26 n=1 Tax=Excalfactoria chinensis TaxID=46218 RepID=UPI003B3A002A
MRAAVWNARSALLYSIGGWTMLGGVLHYNYKNSGGAEDGYENKSDDKADEERSRNVVVTNAPLGIQLTTVTTYHKELPPLTRFLRRVTAYFSAGSSPPPSES